MLNFSCKKQNKKRTKNKTKQPESKNNKRAKQTNKIATKYRIEVIE